MGDEAKSGTHLAEANQVLTFSFLELIIISGAIYLKFHPQRGCPQKKKVYTCFAAPFMSFSAQIVIKLEFLAIMLLLTGTHVPIS